MKILFLTLSDDVHGFAGNSIHIRELAKALDSLGYSIYLVAGYNKKTICNDIDLEDSINVNYVKNIFKMSFPKSTLISKIFLSSKAIQKFKPNVIYERNFNCYIGALLSKVFRIPLVVEINGLVDEEIMLQDNKINNSKSKRKMSNWIRKKSFNQAQVIVAVTDGIKNELQSNYNISPKKINVIANGANIDLFKPMDQNEVKEYLGLNLKNKYICFVGNLAPWQGVEYLIKAASIVLKKVPEARFLIVGDGMMREDLENMVNKMDLQNKFVFTGSVSFDMVPKYINASDVCTVPKKVMLSGFSPLKLYEYMACGKPVVATDTNGFEILKRYNTGLLTNPKNTILFSNAIINLLQNKQLSEKMGADGRKLVVRKYSWRNTAMKVAGVCHSVIK